MSRPSWFRVCVGLAIITGSPRFSLVAASQLPPGFVESTFVSGVNDPRAIAFLPTGSLLVGCGGGNVYKTDGGAATLIGHVTTDTNGERGLNGLAVDPEFALNSWVWIYYTAPDPPRNRLSHFTLNHGELHDESVVLEGPATLSAFHNAGCVRFASDDTIFISMGDDAQFSTTSQNPYDLRGKILHIRRDGSPASDNPFLVGGGDPRVWALGFRNPFRFNIQPGATGTPNLFIGDVGGESYEEVDVGVSGGNFGWATIEGPEPPGQPGFVYPIYSYSHGDGGASIIGGDHAKPGDLTPSVEGSYFFGDWVRREIYRMTLDERNQVVDVETWATGIAAPADILFGPDGALYYAAQGIAEVRRIEYVGGSNEPPVAVANASPTNGAAPVAALLDGSGSYDPDGPVVTASWDPGDSTGIVTGEFDAHVYQAGVYYARLTVRDQTGSINTAPPIRIVSGNAAPIAWITAPSPALTYGANRQVWFSGGDLDPEEGSLPCARYTWQVLLHHDDHTHPYLGPVQGICSGYFVTADEGETSPNTWYEILLTVADDGLPLGPEAVLTGGSSVSIFLRTTTLTFNTEPRPDLQLTLDTRPFAAPASVTGVWQYRRTVGALDQVGPDRRTWRWLSWSDGGAAAHEIRWPQNGSVLTAAFGCNVIQAASNLQIERGENGQLTLLWGRVNDTCLHASPGRFAIYAAASPRPATSPGSFPTDPTFRLVGTSSVPSYSFVPDRADSYFLVIPLGSDELPGPVEHYGS